MESVNRPECQKCAADKLWPTWGDVDVFYDPDSRRWAWRIHLIWNNSVRCEQRVETDWSYASATSARNAAKVWMARLGLAEREEALA